MDWRAVCPRCGNFAHKTLSLPSQLSWIPDLPRSWSNVMVLFWRGPRQTSHANMNSHLHWQMGLTLFEVRGAQRESSLFLDSLQSHIRIIVLGIWSSVHRLVPRDLTWRSCKLSLGMFGKQGGLNTIRLGRYTLVQQLCQMRVASEKQCLFFSLSLKYFMLI